MALVSTISTIWTFGIEGTKILSATGGVANMIGKIKQNDPDLLPLWNRFYKAFGDAFDSYINTDFFLPQSAYPEDESDKTLAPKIKKHILKIACVPNDCALVEIFQQHSSYKFDHFLYQMDKSSEFRTKVAADIFQKFELETLGDTAEVKRILEAVLQHYYAAFLCKMTDKEGQQAILQAVYANSNSLKIIEQKIDSHKLYFEKIIKLLQQLIIPQAPKIDRYLTKAPPEPPAEFLGREKDLDDIHQFFAARQSLLLLVNGIGGIGKSTLAQAFFHQANKQQNPPFGHLAWLDVTSAGIAAAFLDSSLPASLAINLNTQETEDQKMDSLLRAMLNLPSPHNLLVIDNANDAENIKQYENQLLGLPNWRILLTSRAQPKGIATQKVGQLSPEDAVKLFLKHHRPAADQQEMVETLVKAVGRHTLVIELLAKNLELLARRGYTVQHTYDEVKEKGLLQIKTRKVHLNYKNLKKAKPEEVVSAIFDFNLLDENEKNLLSQFALFPAQFIPYPHLIKMLDFEPQENRMFKQIVQIFDKEQLTAMLKSQNLDISVDDFLGKIEQTQAFDEDQFDDTLDALVEKGWLEKDPKAASYKLHQVIQEVLKADAPPTYERHQSLVKSLEYIMDKRHTHLNSSSQYTSYAESLCNALADTYHPQVGFLNVYLAEVYTALGRWETVERSLRKSAIIFEKNEDKANLAVSYSKLGVLHKAKGELEQALHFFTRQTKLFEELHESNPQSESLKNGLATSYEKLGALHQAKGELEQALHFFTLRKNLGEELHESNPQSESLKNGLAISYHRLGALHESKGELDEALKFFILYKDLSKEASDSNPKSEKLKNDLAISYSKLGDLHQTKGELDKALHFFTLRKNLVEQLHAANPQSESLKNGLAISYQRLGRLHQTKGELNEALKFFTLYKDLAKEVSDNNPKSEKLKNDLAISYSNLGALHQAKGELDKALHFFTLDMELTKQLHAANPQSESLKNGLAISYSKLGDLHQAKGELDKALHFFTRQTKLFEQLHAANPQNYELYNGLGISYYKLGAVAKEQGKDASALAYFRQALSIFEALEKLTKLPMFTQYAAGMRQVIQDLEG